MGIISVERANNLLWLGRYSERVYTTLRMFYLQFDNFISVSLPGKCPATGLLRERMRPGTSIYMEESLHRTLRFLWKWKGLPG